MTRQTTLPPERELTPYAVFHATKKGKEQIGRRRRLQEYEEPKRLAKN